MAMLEFDEQTSKRIEAAYSARDVLRRRGLVREALAARPGERIADIGCGPGFYVDELAREVGPEGSVVGIDGSDSMLALAAHRNRDNSNVGFERADATSLPLEDESCDRALSVQVLEYVSELELALAEIRRVLRPGGRVVIWDVDWETLSIHTDEPERMRRVLDAWDQHLTHTALPRTLGGRLRAAGFERVTMQGHAFATDDATTESYGGFLVAFVEQFLLDRGFGEREARAWADEQRELDRRGEFYAAVIQFCFSAVRPA
jgi:arsenite methyltransferase